MHQIDWLQMLDYRQSMHHFSRKLLLQSRESALATSDLEILSLLYLHPEENTPLALSRRSGMKKEAISRSIRQLSQLGCLEKNVNPQDERSYGLSLTKIGLQKLSENYAPILQPMYNLQRKMGDDFETLFRLLEKANLLLEEQK